MRYLKLPNVGSVNSNHYGQMAVQNGGRAKNAPEIKCYLPVTELILHKVYE